MTWALEGCVISVLVLVFGMQVWLALKIRRYAHYLENLDAQTEQTGELRMREKEMC